jgi:hypothetical protein
MAEPRVASEAATIAPRRWCDADKVAASIRMHKRGCVYLGMAAVDGSRKLESMPAHTPKGGTVRLTEGGTRYRPGTNL